MPRKKSYYRRKRSKRTPNRRFSRLRGMSKKKKAALIAALIALSVGGRHQYKKRGVRSRELGVSFDQPVYAPQLGGAFSRPRRTARPKTSKKVLRKRQRMLSKIN